jgi:hypothetical protein
MSDNIKRHSSKLQGEHGGKFVSEWFGANAEGASFHTTLFQTMATFLKSRDSCKFFPPGADWQHHAYHLD